MPAAPEPWFSHYFGPDYLRIYHFADTRDQLGLLRRFLAHLAPGEKVLDLPCGHGRHACEVARWGYRVYGLDLQREFLGVARANADPTAAPRLVQGDMRCFPFAAAAFDAAVCLFTSLGYFAAPDDNQRVLDEFARVLKPGRRFLLDLANIEQVRHQPDSKDWHKDGLHVRSRYAWDETTKHALTHREVVADDGRTATYESSVRLYEQPEIAAMLTQAGFVIDDVLGAYTGEPVAPELPRRILLCHRAA